MIFFPDPTNYDLIREYLKATKADNITAYIKELLKARSEKTVYS